MPDVFSLCLAVEELSVAPTNSRLVFLPIGLVPRTAPDTPRPLWDHLVLSAVIRRNLSKCNLRDYSGIFMVILSKIKKSINQTKSASSTTFKMPDKRRNSTRFITTTGHICDNEKVLFITVASFLVTQRKSQKGKFMGHENRLVSSQHVLGGGEFTDCTHPSLP